MLHVEIDDEVLVVEVERSSMSASRIRVSKGEGDGVNERDHRTRPPWVLWRRYALRIEVIYRKLLAYKIEKWSNMLITS